MHVRAVCSQQQMPSCQEQQRKFQSQISTMSVSIALTLQKKHNRQQQNADVDPIPVEARRVGQQHNKVQQQQQRYSGLRSYSLNNHCRSAALALAFLPGRQRTSH